jgi:transmembrane sensor
MLSDLKMRVLSNKRHEEAAAWFGAQRRGAMLWDERLRLDAWRSDHDNQATLDGMHELWRELEGLKGVIGHRSTRPSAWRAAWALPQAACLALAVVGALWLFNGRTLAQTASTAAGEQHATTLPDGTVADLNVVSRIDYRMGARRRDVQLRDGEVLFFVHKEPLRPFVVRAGDYEVRDIGTAFDVSHRKDHLLVSVLEGTVIVRAVAGPEAGREVARLTPGKQLSLVHRSGTSWTAEVRSVQVPAMASWRQQTVSYEDVPVADVVEDLNRYFARRLEIADPAVAARRVTMHLQLVDRDRTLDTLSRLLGMKIQHGKDADLVTSGS